MQLEVIRDKRQYALAWYSERLDVQWVGGGTSPVKASASITQLVVQLWMASAGASLGGSCSPDNNGVSVHSAHTLGSRLDHQVQVLVWGRISSG